MHSDWLDDLQTLEQFIQAMTKLHSAAYALELDRAIMGDTAERGPEPEIAPAVRSFLESL